MLQKIWNWLNGNKTLFGTALIALQEVWVKLVNDIWHFVPDWNQPFTETLLYVGGLLVGTGIIHRMAKSNTNPGPNA